MLGSGERQRNARLDEITPDPGGTIQNGMILKYAVRHAICPEQEKHPSGKIGDSLVLVACVDSRLLRKRTQSPWEILLSRIGISGRIPCPSRLHPPHLLGIDLPPRYWLVTMPERGVIHVQSA